LIKVATANWLTQLAGQKRLVSTAGCVGELKSARFRHGERDSRWRTFFAMKANRCPHARLGVFLSERSEVRFDSRPGSWRPCANIYRAGNFWMKLRDDASIRRPSQRNDYRGFGCGPLRTDVSGATSGNGAGNRGSRAAEKNRRVLPSQRANFAGIARFCQSP